MQSFYAHPDRITADAVFERLAALDGVCPFTRLRTVGVTAAGRPILALEAGKMHSPALFVGGTHGMEWASVLCCLRLAETVCEDAALRDTLFQRGAVFLPLLNPDGFSLRRQGASACPKSGFLRRLDPKAFTFWQANGRGVDLNRNFAAGFFRARRAAAVCGVRHKGPTRWGGPFPFSERETRAVRALCRDIRPRTLYTLHSQGEEIYWQYGKTLPAGSAEIAGALAALSGYALAAPDAVASHAGLKDWFIRRCGRPAFTVELGRGSNPLPYEDFPAIWARVEKMLLAAVVL